MKLQGLGVNIQEHPGMVCIVEDISQEGIRAANLSTKIHIHFVSDYISVLHLREVEVLEEHTKSFE